MGKDDCLAEAKYMNTLRHPKLVQLLAVCTRTEHIWVITELMINGTLIDYLRTAYSRRDEGKMLKFVSLADIAGQVRLIKINSWEIVFVSTLYNGGGGKELLLSVLSVRLSVRPFVGFLDWAVTLT